MAFLLRLSQYIASSQEPKDFWSQLLLALQGDHLDLPFAIVYSAGGDINETLSESSELSSNLRNWTLEGLVRVPETCTSIPRRINSEQAMEDFLPDFYNLVKQDTPTLLRSNWNTARVHLSRHYNNYGWRAFLQVGHLPAYTINGRQCSWLYDSGHESSEAI